MACLLPYVAKCLCKQYTSQDEEKLAKEREREYEEVLPWKVEQKVACCLHPIKMPLIILATLLGCSLEAWINWLTTSSTLRPRYVEICYVHQLDARVGAAHNFKVPDAARERINDTFGDIVDSNNGSTKVVLIPEIPVFNFMKDTCGVMVGAPGEKVVDKGVCVPDLTDKGTTHIEEYDATSTWQALGLNRLKVPFFYHSLVWGIYKLVFLPLHWPDRILRCASAGVLKEPVFKLVMQPYFERLTKSTDITAKIGACFRYMMLPNTLLKPFTTLGYSQVCPGLYYYVMDRYLGQVIYFWCFGDLVFTAFLFLLGHTLYHNSVIGSWGYTVYKVWWFLTTPIALLMFIVDIIITTDLRFWNGLYLARFSHFTMNLRFEFIFVVDITQAIESIVVFLDTVQIVVLILCLVFPKCGQRVPLVKRWIQEDEEAEKKEKGLLR